MPSCLEGSFTKIAAKEHSVATLRARGSNNPGVKKEEALAYGSPEDPRSGRGGNRRAPEGHDNLKVLVEGYKGFGILTLIRTLIFRGLRPFMLAIVGIVLLVGQWTGPVGFIAFKVTTDKREYCNGDGGVWAKCVVASVAMIYFSRLSLAALAHRQHRPQEFEDYRMPKWWGIYRHLDLVVTSLLYDTFIFLANLFIVFQDRSVSDMVLDVLALEFFTTIDDQFKAAVIEYDSTFLYDIVLVEATPAELCGPQRLEEGLYPAHATTSMPSALTEAEFRREGGGFPAAEERKACCDEAGGVFCYPLKLMLLVVRAICRVGGPFCAFIMVFYGPLCIGAPN